MKRLSTPNAESRAKPKSMSESKPKPKPKPKPSVFRTNLRSWIKSQKQPFGYEELAARLGEKRSTVQAWAHDDCWPSDVLEKLARLTRRKFFKGAEDASEHFGVKVLTSRRKRKWQDTLLDIIRSDSLLPGLHASGSASRSTASMDDLAREPLLTMATARLTQVGLVDDLESMKQAPRGQIIAVCQVRVDRDGWVQDRSREPSFQAIVAQFLRRSATGRFHLVLATIFDDELAKKVVNDLEREHNKAFEKELEGHSNKAGIPKSTRGSAESSGTYELSRQGAAKRVYYEHRLKPQFQELLENIRRQCATAKGPPRSRAQRASDRFRLYTPIFSAADAPEDFWSHLRVGANPRSWLLVDTGLAGLSTPPDWRWRTLAVPCASSGWLWQRREYALEQLGVRRRDGVDWTVDCPDALEARPGRRTSAL